MTTLDHAVIPISPSHYLISAHHDAQDNQHTPCQSALIHAVTPPRICSLKERYIYFSTATEAHPHGDMTPVGGTREKTCHGWHCYSGQGKHDVCYPEQEDTHDGHAKTPFSDHCR